MFNVGDTIHAKPNATLLKQNILVITATEKKFYKLEDLLTNKKYVFPKDYLGKYFVKTFCYTPPKHPNTDLFK